MSLSGRLRQRAAEDRPIRVGLIGAGTFGLMFLAQVPRTPGLHVVAIADLEPERLPERLEKIGWPRERSRAGSIAEALRDGSTRLTADVGELIDADAVDVVVEATGSPAAGVEHAIRSVDAGCHVVMVTVEADVLAGPLLARRAAEAGVVYSLASGDQPALICDLIDWAQGIGLEIVAAGKGTRFLPEYRSSTPETVWEGYDLDPERAREAGFNPQMFNSFLDGTKSAIEMAAVANASGLAVPTAGLAFPPASIDDLARVLRPREEGGVLEREGMVEVVSSLARDGTPIERDLRWGVYVVFRAPDDYVAGCFRDYGVPTDSSGRFAALVRPLHLIGLELGTSVASVALRGEATGAPEGFRADVVAVARRDLQPGDVLDGEGGMQVRGELTPSADSLEHGSLPIGLAHGVAVKRQLAAGEVVRWSDVEIDEAAEPAAFRRQMERAFGAGTA